MKDAKLTEIMLKSLKEDASLASADDWMHAGDFAMEMRFFPHAFKCYRLASHLKKNDEEILNKVSDVLDKITNVLEFLPKPLKNDVEEIRLNNPLDPSKWLAISNKLLKELTIQVGKGIKNDELYHAARFALAFSAYTAIRSGNDIEPINKVLETFNEEIELQNYNSPKLNLTEMALSKNGDALKVVALGDNVTLGLYPNWEIKFQDTYHYNWAKESNLNISLANNAVSGSGVLDLALYLGRDLIHYKPDLAILNFGINDTWLGPQSLAAFEILYEECIYIIQEHKIKVILVSPIPHLPENCPEDLRPSDLDPDLLMIDPYVEATKRIAKKTGVVFADAFAKFPKNREAIKKLLANGFNQPNSDGQNLIKQAIQEVCI
jgi:lysophospholipase L1-like esterase